MDEIRFVAASETGMMFASEEENWEDRKRFVENLGKFATQCRNSVVRMYLDEEDCVHIVYRGGGEHKVNVRHDSYAAIVRDVFARI
jgi:hypothetical protein